MSGEADKWLFSGAPLEVGVRIVAPWGGNRGRADKKEGASVLEWIAISALRGESGVGGASISFMRNLKYCTPCDREVFKSRGPPSVRGGYHSYVG